MDLSDHMLITNRDWDPSYLKDIFAEDFNDYSELWESDIMDSEIVTEVNRLEHYCPIVEDISLDDVTLSEAVEKIENE